ncbi:Respiratory nitrate reductase alpha chain [Salmonella enterica subsp. enterica serovar Alachua str. R6-377]|uniref:Respiratory nitrate reductase alpha chain n=1 Tax=Salmonella enterica subsp. enterica serovar Alachua str. R6-377 TaxID=913241 RepID=G5LN65_SALET|nr:Respiratory nitrate reductase alpha chain [Salmonella enterica subsp. enterica serovar Alachua str. R6-377]
MSKFLDRFRYFKQKGETFADGHGQLLETNRDWEDGYRQRWIVKEVSVIGTTLAA